MNIGKRKVAAAVGALGIVALGVAAYWLADTDGLVVLTLATVAVSTGLLGWFVANSERRLRRLSFDLNAAHAQVLREEIERDRKQITRGLANAGVSGKQAEALMRSIRTGFARFELEWAQSREDLLNTFRQTLEREVGLVRSQVEVVGGQVEVASRDVSLVGHEMRAAFDRIDVTADQIASLASATQEAYADIQSTVKTEMARQTRQQVTALFRRLIDESVSEMDALLQLRERFPVPGKQPVLGGWAIGPGAILYVLEQIEANDLDLVVECGPGASTVYVAELFRHRGRGRVIGLEHDPAFHATVSEDIAARGLSEYADIRLAPLVEVEALDRTQLWYDPSQLEGITGIDLLLVDGPPQDTGEMARFPAVAILDPVLAEDAVVVVDDAFRSGEQAAIERWRNDLSWTPSVTPPGGFVALRRSTEPTHED